MTTYARKIAEAVRDAAVNACEKTEDRYAEENRFKVPELQESAETGARDCEHAVKTLDLDAIIAGVPEPQAAEPVAWAAVHFGGKKNGKIFATCETKEQAKAYIDQVHQSDDSITLTSRPIAFADAPPAALPASGE